MKFKAFDKLKGEYVKNVFIGDNGHPILARGDEELDSLINEYYQKKGDSFRGDYMELDFTDWYAIDNIIIEWYDDNDNRIE